MFKLIFMEQKSKLLLKSCTPKFITERKKSVHGSCTAFVKNIDNFE